MCALDGNLVAAGTNDGYVRLWDATSGAMLAERKVAQPRGKKKTGAMPCGVGNCFGIGNMGVSKHRGGFPPKWMIWGGKSPYFWKHPYVVI